MNQTDLPASIDIKGVPDRQNPRFVLLQPFIIALLVVLLVIVWFDVRSQVQETDQRLLRVDETVNAQTSVISRALGAVIPIKLPEDVDARISAVEQVMQDPKQWPTNVEDVSRMAAEFGELVGKLPSWVQEEALPRIVPLRWDLQALSLLRQDIPTNLDLMAELSDAVLEHSTDRPSTASEPLAKELIERRSEIEKRHFDAERNSAFEYGHAVVDGKGDPMEALTRLEKYEEDDTEARALRERIRDAAILRAADGELSTLEAELERFKGLSDDSLREYGLFRQQQALMELRFRLASSGKDHASLLPRIRKLEDVMDTALKALSARKADFQQEVSKNYQVWALDQIKAIPTYDALESTEVQKITSVLDRNNPLSAARKHAKKVAQENLANHLVDRMARIDQRLLDEAVAIWFRKVFQDRFATLDEAQQLRVVASFATARKQPLVNGK